MEILYRAFDGKIFHSPEECLKHEKTDPYFKMWARDGFTTDPADALVVHIISEFHGAEKFVAMCEDWDISHEGIDDCSCTGFYIWDDGQWVLVPDDTLEALAAMFDEKE